MAKMNREILVPYLQDVCALHLAKKKCQERLENLSMDYEKERERYGHAAPLPMYQHMKEDEKLFGALSIVGFFGVPFVLLQWGVTGVLIDILVAIVLGVLHLTIQKSRQEKARIFDASQRRKYAQDSLEHRKKTNRMCEQYNDKISSLEQEIRTIDGLMDRAYAANLIPSRYRDIYAAVYLYDWFSTGMSDDMDMALNTYVLEQIKSRLDTIIRNQAEQIINQRAILANQARTMNMIERNAKEMREKVSRMNESLEKQNMYLNMIDSNVAATRYFAEETYKKWN